MSNRSQNRGTPARFDRRDKAINSPDFFHLLHMTSRIRWAIGLLGTPAKRQPQGFFGFARTTRDTAKASTREEPRPFRKESNMKISICGQFLRPMAVAAALALTTVGLPAQPAKAMTYDQCLAMVESYNEALTLGDLFYTFGASRAATFQYNRARAIAQSFDELC
jgi:hypothetical protein